MNPPLVVIEIVGAARVVLTGPLVNVLAGIVEQVGVGALHGRHEGVAGAGIRGVEEDAHGLREFLRAHDAEADLEPTRVGIAVRRSPEGPGRVAIGDASIAVELLAMSYRPNGLEPSLVW